MGYNFQALESSGSSRLQIPRTQIEAKKRRNVLPQHLGLPKLGRPKLNQSREREIVVKKKPASEYASSLLYHCSFDCHRKRPYRRINYFLRHLLTFHKMSIKAVEGIGEYIYRCISTEDPTIKMVRGYRILTLPSCNQKFAKTPICVDASSAPQPQLSTTEDTDVESDLKSDLKRNANKITSNMSAKKIESEPHDPLPLPEKFVSPIKLQKLGFSSPIDKPILTKRPHSFSDYRSYSPCAQQTSTPINGVEREPISPFLEQPAKKRCFRNSKSLPVLEHKFTPKTAVKSINMEPMCTKVPSSLQSSSPSMSCDESGTYGEDLKDLNSIFCKRNLFEDFTSVETTEPSCFQHSEDDSNNVPDLDYNSNVSTIDCSFEETYPEVCNIEMDLQLSYTDLSSLDRNRELSNDWFIPSLGDPRILDLGLL